MLYRLFTQLKQQLPSKEKVHACKHFKDFGSLVFPILCVINLALDGYKSYKWY